MVSVLSSLGTARRIFVNGIVDVPIILDGDDKSKDNDDDLDTEPAPRTLDSEQLSNDAFNAETLPNLSNRTPNERNNDNGLGNNASTPTAKRQRSPSPRSPLHHARTSPLPQSNDAKSSRENINHADLDKSADDDVLSKRHRPSAPLSGKTTLTRHKNQSRRSPPILVEEEEEEEAEEDGTLNISVDSASTARTTPAAIESARPAEPQPAVQVNDANQEWEVREIIGKEDIGGVPHYLVGWSPTLVPQHLLGHAKELLDEFEAQLRAKRGAKNRRGPGLKRDERAVVEADVSRCQQKRPRGRPRRQT